MIRYGSVCSGVEAATLAWKPLGWECVFVSEVEPFPCAVLQERLDASRPIHPLDPVEAADEKDAAMRRTWMKQNEKLRADGIIPNEGDFTKIGDKYRGKIDLLVGGTPCFPAGNLVLTEFGYVPIENIHVGDLVMSHKGRLCRVLKTGNKVANNVGECKVIGRPAFRVTANHPFLVGSGKRVNVRSAWNYGKIDISGVEFKPISESVGAFGCFLNVDEHPCVIPAPQFPHVYSASRSKFLELCGWYLGDGYVRLFNGKNKKSVVLCLSEKKLVDFISSFSGVIHYNYSAADKNNVFKVTISCTALADFLLTWFGHLAAGKRVPAWCYGLSGNDLASFLRGYTLTDGCVMERLTSFSSVSQSLVYSIADLCSYASVYRTDVEPTTVIDGRTVNQRNLYECKVPHSVNSKHFAFDRWLCCRIRSFELQKKPEIVYNLEVENDNSYICNGLCVHNCQDLSVAGLRAGFEGERSVLAIDFVRLAYQSNCRWFLWENVPGVFSSNGGGDFARLLSLFTGCDVGVPEQGFGSAGFVCNARRDRFGVAWRVLDAQFTRVPGCFPFAIPQRRRRVFVVGYLGDWRRAAEVLLEPQCMSWPAPTRRKTRKASAVSLGSGVKDASAIRMRSGCEGGEKGALVGRELSHTLATGNDQAIVTIGLGRDVIKSGENSKFSFSIIENAQPTLTARGEGGVCIKNDAICDVVISLASGQGGEWGCLGVDAAQTLSLNNGGFHYIACYENHANDSRVTFSGSVCPALTSRAGTGGGNLPLVMSSSELCFDVGNGQVDCSMHPLYECATTLHCMHDANAVMCVPINSMIIGKDVTLTDRQTTGIGEDGDALPTLQANHHHAVACSQYGEIAGTLTARYDSSPCVDRGQTVVASFMGGQGSAAGGIGYRKELSPTIKASPSGGNTVPDVMVAACVIAENVIGRQIHNGGNGVGAKLEVAYTIDTVGVQGVAVDVVDKQGMALRDVVPTLTATSFKEAPAISIYANVSISEELENVDAKKTHPSEILRILREIIGEKAFSEWFRRHACVSEEEILQQNVHGSSVRCEAVSFNKTQHMPLSCEKNCLAWKMRNLWQGECIGRSSQGQGFQKQCSVESSSNLSKLSQQDSSSEKDVCDMWQTAKGAWLLHEALGEIQKIRKSIAIQAKPIRYNTFGFVRRLLPIETERLMGFPDNHTRIPWNGRSELECPDGPRYKACGNSFCVNVVRWIGEQIQRVDNMEDADDATAEK